MTQENQNTPNEETMVLLQFYADWCQPCNAMMPVVASIQQKQADWLSVQQINVDSNSAVANQFHIRSIPTFVVLKNNQEIWRTTGVMTEYSFTETLIALKK